MNSRHEMQYHSRNLTDRFFSDYYESSIYHQGFIQRKYKKICRRKLEKRFIFNQRRFLIFHKRQDPIKQPYQTEHDQFFCFIPIPIKLLCFNFEININYSPRHLKNKKA